MSKKKIFIISGPSGAGEDSIITRLREELTIDRVVTTTTRAPRPGEIEGVSYYFITQEHFEEKKQNGEFFEHALQQNGQQYGVTHEEIQRVMNSHKIGIWKIEYQGVIQAKKLLNNQVISIYISVLPSILEERIRARGSMSEEQIAERMAYTKEWMQHLDIYDYTVENKQGELVEAVQRVKEIILANN